MVITQYFKALLGAIALGCAIYCAFARKLVPSQIVACYWFGVAIYWIVNCIGG